MNGGSIVSMTQSRSPSRTFRGLSILGLVMVVISLMLPYRQQSLAIPIAVALAAMVLASVLVYFFYRSLLGKRQASFLYLFPCFVVLGLAAVSISLRLDYLHGYFGLAIALAVAGTVLALIGGYFICRFLLGRGPGTYAEIKAMRRTLNVKT